MASLIKKVFAPVACAAIIALPAFADQAPDSAPVPATATAPDVNTADGLAAAIARASGPVLVEFGAPWCPYCRREKPFIEALRDKKAGQMDIYEVNTDKNPQISSQYKIHGLPTFIVFYQGKVAGRTVGGTYGRDLDNWVSGVEAKIRQAERARPKSAAPKAGS